MKFSFAGKKVTVMGLGLFGGGVAVVTWLVKYGAQVTITDLKTKKALVSSLQAIGPKILRRCQVILGRHRFSDFEQADLIVQNPGVPGDSVYINRARKMGIPIENDASLFFKYCSAPIIGVTGTRGKSTTAALIAAIVSQHFKKQKKVWLLGQPQKPMLAALDRISADDIAVVELSSWQLEVLGAHRLSPRVAVVTNIYPDHLNRYRGMAEYVAAKKNIVRFQTVNGVAVLNADNVLTKQLSQAAAGKLVWFSSRPFTGVNGCFVKNGSIISRLNGSARRLADIADSNLLGGHNVENLVAATAVASLYKVAAKEIKTALRNFHGLPGRIELVKIAKKVHYINDTTATTPDATMAALTALSAKHFNQTKNIILIAGGSGKKIPMEKYHQLAKVIQKTCRAVILFSGPGSDQITIALRHIKYRPVLTGQSKMKDIVATAAASARPGDLVLLSPASASFNHFVNEYDRGQRFNEAVRQL